MSRKRCTVSFTAALVFMAAAFMISLTVGKYPIRLSGLLAGTEPDWRIFLTLRLPRTVMALVAGFGLSFAGFIYQMIFKNPLAAPDVIGVSSGASAGAAAGILFFHTSTAAITFAAFLGGLAAVFLALGLSFLSRDRNLSSMVLSGIAVNALAQAVLMLLKFTADPEQELASIEYWMMGSLGGVTASRLPFAMTSSILCMALLFLMYRRIMLLTLDEDEARMLGVPVLGLRLAALTAATLVVASIVSVTGLISFIGLLAPHTARLLLGDSRRPSLVLSGILGGGLLLAADLFARSISAGELPVSILTSVLGAPFLLWLVLKGARSLG